MGDGDGDCLLQHLIAGRLQDGRSRLLRLSASGKELVRRLQPLWKILNATSLELDAEADHVIAALDRLDRALERLSLYDRVRQKLASRKPR